MNSLPSIGAGGGIQQILALRQQIISRNDLLREIHTAQSANQPGTTEALYPNWQVPLGGPDGKPVYLDDLPANKRFTSLLAAVEGALHG